MTPRHRLTDVFGVSGHKMLKALVASDVVEIDQITKLAHWKLEPKIEQIKKALEGKLTDHHRFLIDLSLNHMEIIEKQLIKLDQEIDRRLAKHQQYLRAALVDCAWGATRKKGSRFRAQYYSIKSRRGSKRAIVAVAHSLLLTIYAVLHTGRPYSEPEPPPLSETKRLKKASDLCRKLRHLGFDIALKEKIQIQNA